MGRPKPPPEDMPWKEPLHDPGPVVIFDIDGVLADMRPFQHLIEADSSRQKDWKEFHRNFSNARPIKAGLTTAKRIFHELDIDLAYSTTRPEQHARRTLRWFEKHDVPMGPIQFRHYVRDGPRPPAEVKVRHWREWQKKWADDNPVLAWIEDDTTCKHELLRHGCPAWGPKELMSAAREHGSLKAALEAGPMSWDELAANRDGTYDEWREAENEWDDIRRQWWQEEKVRQRQIRQERRAHADRHR